MRDESLELRHGPESRTIAVFRKIVLGQARIILDNRMIAWDDEQQRNGLSGAAVAWPAPQNAQIPASPHVVAF